MKKYTFDEFHKIIGGEIKRNNFEGNIENASCGTRYIHKNAVFFYTSRSKLYRDDFVNTNNIIVTDKELGSEFDDFTIIYVKNIRAALKKFVTHYRALFDIPVIGVTGTCGKTTTKEMIKHILSKFYNVQGTILSNNAAFLNIRYLVKLNDNIDVGVYEMGVGWPNDIIESAMYFKPNIGIITNIGYDHFKGCKNLEGYIKAKSKMLEVIDESGFLILNKDCENISKINTSDFNGRLIYFGKTDCEYKISNIDVLRMTYVLNHNDENYVVKVPGLGEHNMYNVTAAIIACNLVGVSIADSIEQLEDFKHVHKHLELKKGVNGSTIIDDSFSSNPTALKAAITVLSKFPKKKVVILSKMGCLGSLEEELHREMGRNLGEVDYLFTLDQVSKLIAEGAIEAGLDESRIYMLENTEDIEDILVKLLDSDTVVLFKTSMFGGFDDVLKYIVDD
ncbi:UDP-N-acetylmuramoyl-tripeptide--D-alanyl-D-alanine ligase [Mycoplasmatota bacterium WC44]